MNTSYGKLHKKNCQCASCRSIRGEYHPSKETRKKIGDGSRGRVHKEDCQCASCQTKRGNPYPISRDARSKASQHWIGDKNPSKKPENRIRLKKLRLALLGPLSSNWKGGIGKQPYPFEFQEDLKEQIRYRDNYTCQLCGRTQNDELRYRQKRLAVHHIDYVKENLFPENLITLCCSCNPKVNSHREYWSQYFREEIAARINKLAEEGEGDVEDVI